MAQPIPLQIHSSNIRLFPHIIAAILLGSLLTGCVTTAAYNRICNECRPVVEQKTDSASIKEKITKRDTSIVKPAKQGPSVEKAVEVSKDDTAHHCPWRDAIEELERHPETKTENGITTTLHAVKEDGKEKIEAECREEEYRIRLNNAITEREIYKQNWELLVKKEKEKRCELPHKTTYTHWAEWGFPVMILLFLFWCYCKIRRFITGIPWP